MGRIRGRAAGGWVVRGSGMGQPGSAQRLLAGGDKDAEFPFPNIHSIGWCAPCDLVLLRRVRENEGIKALDLGGSWTVSHTGGDEDGYHAGADGNAG